jgi:hypothetical protein
MTGLNGSRHERLRALQVIGVSKLSEPEGAGADAPKAFTQLYRLELSDAFTYIACNVPLAVTVRVGDLRGQLISPIGFVLTIESGAVSGRFEKYQVMQASACDTVGSPKEINTCPDVAAHLSSLRASAAAATARAGDQRAQEGASADQEERDSTNDREKAEADDPCPLEQCLIPPNQLAVLRALLGGGLEGQQDFTANPTSLDPAAALAKATLDVDLLLDDLSGDDGRLPFETASAEMMAVGESETERA